MEDVLNSKSCNMITCKNLNMVTLSNHSSFKVAGLERRCNTLVVSEGYPENRVAGSMSVWCSDSSIESHFISRGSAAIARWVHNPKVGGLNPSPVTTPYNKTMRRRFNRESKCMQIFWIVWVGGAGHFRLSARTQGFHPCKMGSIPVGAASRQFNSARWPRSWWR